MISFNVRAHCSFIVGKYYECLTIYLGHEWIYDVGRLLYHDINVENVMFCHGLDGEVHGVLNDFDSTTTTGIDDSKNCFSTPSRRRFGTESFMALEKLEQPHVPPRYRHGVESLFFVILILGSRRVKLEAFARKYWRLILTYRLSHFADKPGFHKWVKDISLLLAEGEKALKEWHQVQKASLVKKKLGIEGPKNEGPEEAGKELAKDGDKDKEMDNTNCAFDQDTLGGHVTAHKVRDILGKFNGKFLKTRVFLSNL